jgi:glycosidase
MTYVGAPMIWYGDEVGMWGSDDPFCRKPMLWADLPPNDDPEERIRAGHLDAYRALIALRRESEVLRRGTFKTLVADDARNLWIFERALGNERVIVALNGSTEAQAMPDVGPRDETLFVSDSGEGAEASTVPALGARVLRVR